MSFRLLTYTQGGGAPRAGLLAGDTVVDLEAALAKVDPGFAEKNGVDPTSTFSLV
jgi:2-keto-4-pentenoate hydratase/2-oxohepta-3-ene-1,7-dioic acid hydratase in catechol pathway